MSDDKQKRLYEQRLRDAERVIEDRDHTIERQERALEDRQRQAFDVTDYERPEDVAQILEHRLRGWPRAHWQALVDRIHRFLSETRP